MSRTKPDGLQTTRRARIVFTASAALATMLLAGCNNSKPVAAMGPLPVDVVTVEQSDVPVSNEWVGTLDGYVNANIQPQVTGYLLKQNYREGSVVQKGQVLFQIDPRPFQATLEQAEGAARAGQGSRRSGSGAAAARADQRKPRHAPRRAARHRAKPARHRDTAGRTGRSQRRRCETPLSPQRRPLSTPPR